MSIPTVWAFSIYVDWFKAHGKSSFLARIGPRIFIYINPPPNERLNAENVYFSEIIPGPEDPTSTQLSYLLIPLMKDLKELWQGYHFSPTKIGPSILEGNPNG
ncbi:hypothetical protein O181_101444 [Austropuccinia psidii MF-1]|uniref:Uncharacterized protein n=1 Tax=Austropuccinia psidii MF-1 TaxID=1389203 RepID=A0A9Q3JH69_9BASI|nr:hypothetical protein [Austropuccinia psidii MF-1]